MLGGLLNTTKSPLINVNLKGKEYIEFQLNEELYFNGEKGEYFSFSSFDIFFNSFLIVR